MRNETIAGYIALACCFILWHRAGSPTLASMFMNGVALGFFGRAVYLDWKGVKK